MTAIDQNLRAWFRSGHSRWHILVSRDGTNTVFLSMCGKYYFGISRKVDLGLDQHPNNVCRTCLHSIYPAPKRIKIIRRDPK